MKRKTIGLIILLIILLGTLCFFVETQTNKQKEEITIGNINFTLPPGFQESGKNSLNDVNITNGTHTLFIAEYTDNNISKYIEMYKNTSQSNNYTISTSVTTVDSITVYKALNEQSGAEHYWFIKNNKVYSIYDWENYENIDNIILNLVKSTKD